MKRGLQVSRWWLWGLVGAVLVVGGLLVTRLVLQERPAVTLVSPLPGTVAVPGGAPLRLSFSQPMDPDSVLRALVFEPTRTGRATWEGTDLTFTPNEPFPPGQIITITLSTAARSTLGLPLQTAGSWTFQTAQTMLAYLYPTDGPAGLYALDPLTGDTVALVTPPEGIVDYQVAPSGLSIYYTTPDPAGGTRIMRFERTMGESVELEHCFASLCQGAVLSPNGRWLAYENATALQIWMIPTDGSAPFQVPGSRQPSWSTNNWLAVYDIPLKAYLFHDLETDRSWSIPNQTGEPGTWFPNGVGYLAAEIIADASSHLQFFDFSAPVPTASDLIPGDNHENNTPVISPDGKQVAFARRFLSEERWTRGRQLWLMDPDGRNMRQLTDNGEYNHTSFAWHPNGSQIALVRFNESTLFEPPEIWLVWVDGSDALALVINGYAPQWIP